MPLNTRKNKLNMRICVVRVSCKYSHISTAIKQITQKQQKPVQYEYVDEMIK